MAFPPCLLERIQGDKTINGQPWLGLLAVLTACFVAILKKTSTWVMGVDGYHPDANAVSPPVGFGNGSQIENVNIDRNARHGRNVRIGNVDNLDETDGDGWSIRDGTGVIPMNGIIPDGTVI